MSRILITGINGFIGSSLAKHYHDEGWEVYGIDMCAHEECAWNTYVCDIAHEDIVHILSECRPEVIVHCAGIANVSFSVEHPDEDFEANTVAVHRLLYAIHKAGLTDSRVLFLSSAGVYGQPESLPISENHKTNPISPYALHKTMAEDICSYFIKNYSMDIRIARIFSAYGPGLKKQIFWDMYNKILDTGKLELFGSGEESRDFIYIDDLIKALTIIVEAAKQDDYIYNVANGSQITIKDIARIFVEEYGEDIPVTFNHKNRTGDPDNWCADISRINGLGYSGSVSITEGISRYLTWVKDNK